MICVTVTPNSRTLAKADLLNAARQGDIVELCLDHFHKEPDVKDLISAIDKPMIISCRRPQDGGKWQGTEEERMMLLRQAIVAGPAYVELDLDIANSIPRFGKTQRVISFTRLDRPETDVDAIFDEATNAKADIVKFTWPTPTLDAAWPLLAAVSQKRMVPVVGMGLGRPELTFSLLGAKYGSPWIYAALEQGMEAHPGQATVFELTETYHCHEINSKTAFVAVAGFGPSQVITTRVLNAGFQELDLNVRCLPIEVGEFKHLKKMLDVLRVRAILVQGLQGSALMQLAEHVDAHDARSGYLNLLLKRDDGWYGYNTLWRSGLKALEAELATRSRSLANQNTLVIGNGGIAHSMVHAISQRQGLVSLCGADDKAAQQMAGECKCRYVPFHNLYETLADIVVVADARVTSGTRHGQVNPSLFRPTMTVLDVGNLPIESSLMGEARDRGCRVIDSFSTYQQQIAGQFKAITGKDLPEAALAKGMAQE
ncbi:type I 3-dehydroquinate dehydratase [Planctomicrobium sp. SH661]|uniref:type I 3-dehydroquinate dehydratase n=1 Tax=Planctomicrobium sp. SH661 TaxID=3448124 RepID=UPI003F5B00F5